MATCIHKSVETPEHWHNWRRNMSKETPEVAPEVTEEAPFITVDEAKYLVEKTNEVATTSHQDRNNMSVVVAKLVAIANH